jgi:hypothetical protein
MTKAALPASAVVTRIVVLVLGLALFFDQAGALQMLHLEGAGPGVMMTPVYWVSLLAPVFYLAALWAASNVFVRMANGEAFGEAMVRGLREIGFCLMIGAFCAAVVTPSLVYLIGNRFTEMRGAQFDLGVENVTLALVGTVLVALAREGQKLKSNLDEFV